MLKSVIKEEKEADRKEERAWAGAKPDANSKLTNWFKYIPVTASKYLLFLG